MMTRIMEHRGEGLVFRNPKSKWLTERSWDVLKMKPIEDATATVIGYMAGRKDHRLEGMIGALVLEWEKPDGKTVIFELSGLDDVERFIHDRKTQDFATRNPDKRLPATYSNEHYPTFTKVDFAYRELTKAGIPKEARVLRRRPEE